MKKRAAGVLTLGVSIHNPSDRSEAWAFTEASYTLSGQPGVHAAQLGHQVPLPDSRIPPSFVHIAPSRTLFVGQVHLSKPAGVSRPRSAPVVIVRLSFCDRLGRWLEVTLEPLRMDAEPGTVVFVAAAMAR